jgi:hypothetical protein
MAKKRILALGDSFSLLDKKESHWLEILAQEQNAVVDFMGFGGSSHVDIIAHFWSELGMPQLISQYSYIFYFSTSLLRCSYVLNEEEYITRAEQYYDSNEQDRKWFVYGSRLNLPRPGVKNVAQLTNGIEKYGLIKHVNFEEEKNPYKSMSIKYNVSAGVNSMRGLFWFTHMHGLKNILVIPGMWDAELPDPELNFPIDHKFKLHYDLKNFSEEQIKIFQCPENIKRAHKSTNHNCRAQHEYYAETWKNQFGYF